MNRCEECGSWEAECMADEPVEGCGCARCLSATVAHLKKRIAELLDDAGMACETPPADCDCAGCSYARERCCA